MHNKSRGGLEENLSYRTRTRCEFVYESSERVFVSASTYYNTTHPISSLVVGFFFLIAMKDDEHCYVESALLERAVIIF